MNNFIGHAMIIKEKEIYSLLADKAKHNPAMLSMKQGEDGRGVFRGYLSCVFDKGVVVVNDEYQEETFGKYISWDALDRYDVEISLDIPI
ncbi:MAG: hypothetical protein IBX55_21985 [Methyloprofundus sp.]|nr:hypothetical protein [Methyloprofundus sp.]